MSRSIQAFFGVLFGLMLLDPHNFNAADVPDYYRMAMGAISAFFIACAAYPRS
jgi:hypothetical protein